MQLAEKSKEIFDKISSNLLGETLTGKDLSELLKN